MWWSFQKSLQTCWIFLKGFKIAFRSFLWIFELFTTISQLWYQTDDLLLFNGLHHFTSLSKLTLMILNCWFVQLDAFHREYGSLIQDAYFDHAVDGSDSEAIIHVRLQLKHIFQLSILKNEFFFIEKNVLLLFLLKQVVLS
jgi:hypothetical protein